MTLHAVIFTTVVALTAVGIIALVAYVFGEN